MAISRVSQCGWYWWHCAVLLWPATHPGARTPAPCPARPDNAQVLDSALSVFWRQRRMVLTHSQDKASFKTPFFSNFENRPGPAHCVFYSRLRAKSRDADQDRNFAVSTNCGADFIKRSLSLSAAVTVSLVLSLILFAKTPTFVLLVARGSCRGVWTKKYIKGKNSVFNLKNNTSHQGWCKRTWHPK